MKFKICWCTVVFAILSTSHFNCLAQEKERLRWNKTLTQDTNSFNTKPNQLLAEVTKGLKPGKALDIGMGQGRNSILLAKQGWQVTGIDIADEAVAVALRKAKSEGVNINALLISMGDYDYGQNQWDLIAHVYEGCLDDAAKVEKISNSLKSGGLFVFEFFHREAGDEMNKPGFGCETNSVKERIERTKAFEILLYEEGMGVADFGLKNRKLVKLVARKK